MAFDPRHFVICSKFPLFKANCNLWLYTTSDSLEDCLAENYFQPRMNTKNQDSPEVGDIIQCIVGTGTLAYLRITAKTEKPYNITVEKTYLENEAEIYDAIYTAADKGEQLYQTGVWYAKMYSDTVVPTGSEYEDKNYADFSQVDSDNNPIIVIYEYISGAWTEIQRITPPTEYNGYLPITSKFWDIQEQTGQQGGEVLWSYNTKRFTPFPRIISYDSIHVTGDSTVVIPDNPSSTQIVNKDYVDEAIAAIPTPTVDIVQSIDAEIVGTLTINGSIVSGFSNSNYLILPGTFHLGGSDVSSFEIECSFTTPADMSNTFYVLDGRIRLLMSNGPQVLTLVISETGNFQTITGITTLTASTKYYVKIEYDGTEYKLYLSTDGSTYNLEATATTTVVPEDSSSYKISPFTNAITSTDMSDWFIKRNGQIIWQGMDAPGLHQRVAIGHEVIDFKAPTAQDNSWYRKYADGWVEQGGTKTTGGSGDVTAHLPIEMADTDYWTQVCRTSGASTTTNVNVWVRSVTSTTTITIYASGDTGVRWEVRGMYAQ